MFEVNDIVRLSEKDGLFDWTVRIKKWHENQLVYFLTRPGFEGWFTSSYISENLVTK